MGNEWPLVLFTLSMQASVGLIVMGELIDLLCYRRYGFTSCRPCRLRIRLGAAALTGLGLLASFFHLGSPIKARLSLSNLETSWLSREILLALFFAAAVLLSLLIILRSRAYRNLQRLIMMLAGALGTLLIAAMSKIYMLPAVPLWNSALTPLSFFTSTLLLGLLAAVPACLSRPADDGGMGGSPEAAAEWPSRLIRISAAAALSLLAAGSGMTWALASAARSHASFFALVSSGVLGEPLVVLRLLTALAGALFLLAGLLGARTRFERPAAWFFGAGVLLILASEVTARLYFYSLPAAGRL